MKRPVPRPVDPPSMTQQMFALAQSGHPRADELTKAAQRYNSLWSAYYDSIKDTDSWQSPLLDAVLDISATCNKLLFECTAPDPRFPLDWQKK